MWNFSNILSKRLESANQASTTIAVAIKYMDFENFSKRKTGFSLLKTSVDIFNAAIFLLDSFYKRNEETRWMFHKPIRNISLRVENLISINSISSLDTFKGQKVLYKERKCIVCNSLFFHLSYTAFERHVNNCLDAQKDKKEPETKALHKYLKRIT